MEEISIKPPVLPRLRVKVKALGFVRANKVITYGLAAIRARKNGDKPPRSTARMTDPEIFETVVEIPDLYIQTHKVSFHDPEARRLDEGMKERIRNQVVLAAHYSWTAEMQKRMVADAVFLSKVKRNNAIGELTSLTWEILPLEE